MNESRQRKGVIDWIGIIVPSIIVLVGAVVAYYGGYNKLEQKVSSSCEQFQADIRRIEGSGTIVSVQNSKDIVALQVKFESIDQRLKRIEDGQTELIRLLSRQSGSRTP